MSHSGAYRWVKVNRGDALPAGAVVAGNRKGYGDIYVGKIDHSPGELNVKEGKIDYFWAESYSSSTEGSVLVTEDGSTAEWIELQHGERFPENTVYGGRDWHTDKVWVGRDVRTSEPGKVTCLNNDVAPYTMCRLWCYSYWRMSDVKIAQMLVIAPPERAVASAEPASAELDTSATTEPDADADLEAVDLIVPGAMTARWGSGLSGHRSINISSCFFSAELRNIARSIVGLVRASAGDIIGMAELISDARAAGSGKYTTQEEAMTRCEVSADGKKYLVIHYRKKAAAAAGYLEKLCRCTCSRTQIVVSYAVFAPLNDAARAKCTEEQGAIVSDMFDRLNRTSTLRDERPKQTGCAGCGGRQEKS
jgi:hypothetical protein